MLLLQTDCGVNSPNSILPPVVRCAALQSCCQSASGWQRLQGALQGCAGVWLRVLPPVAATFARLQHLYFLSPGQDLGM
jgi:hypothetical protein